MNSNTTKCPQCAADVPRERLTCKACGFDVFKHGLANKVSAQGTDNGAALGCTVLILATVLAIPLYILNRCSAPPEPTPKELQQAAAEERARTEFERQQAPLWNQPASNMTTERMVEEISKCKSRAEPYGSIAVYWEDYDTDKAVKRIKDGSSYVELYGQRRMEIGSKIAITSFKCYFRGIGFERLDANIEGYTDKFILDW